MVVDLSAANVLDLTAAAALAVLGAALVVLRGRRPAALAFATFCLGLAGLYLAILFGLPPLLDAGVMLAVVGGVVATIALVPRKLLREDAPAVAVFFASAIGFAVLWGELWRERDLLHMIDTLMNASVVGALCAFPIRAAREQDPAARRTLALLAVGFTLFGAGAFASIAQRSGPPLAAELVGVLGLPLALWLWASRGEGHRLARNVVLATVGIVLVAMLLGSVAEDYAYPLSRLGAVSLLAYAVMHGEIAGLDVKVRFAISKGALAAVFVAVFFVASEVAQEIFTARFSSAVGIVATGLLIFALAPLQRAAERLAERAVPVAAPSAPRAAAEIYRAAVRAAMRDGTLTRREERHLAEVARGLGLDPVQAHDILVDVEGRAE